MTAPRNRQVILVSRPEGIPQAANFALREAPLPALQDGEILVHNHLLSVDPAMRGWVSAVANYAKPVGIGEVMRSFAPGEVLESRHPDFAAGERVSGLFGWQDYAAVAPSAVTRKVVEQNLPLSASLGVLGLNGTTAYFALLEIGQPKPGETVVVSTAAGAVGFIVGQIAKLKGCRTIGITGGLEKRRQCLEEFGYDAALDYKAGPIDAVLAEAAPDGVDIYFDNTAGPISDAVLRQLAVRARVVICGTASLSSWDPWPQGPRVERHLLVKRTRMQGFLIFDHAERTEGAVAQLADWVRAGSLAYREDILDGIAEAPGAIARLYRGENSGKLLIRLLHQETLA
ncbi:NADP-dependent oxidoreductase [Falsiroseomonas oryzae]|uniref:NADP-dependent oxidoreductase n=1 Tax=Falsiroseomonas oryzae TaxID=2766473 RepID=UPI0022EAFBF0|nr:NADP-dependent oxidoreductase [Roseomonas sp. MO-31]